MRAAFVCVVLAALAGSAGTALAQGAASPALPIEPQATGSPASQPAPSQPAAVQPQASQPSVSQPPVSQPPVSQPSPAQRSAPPPRTGPVRGVPPGIVNPRRPRTFAQCNQEALRRGMRGAERRHWIQRCELGYGRPLFRRRGPVVTQPPGGGEPAAGADTTPVTEGRGESGAP